MAKDLVCNMDVDEKTAKYKTIYQGKYYYFCAPGCKKSFEANPQKYIGVTRQVTVAIAVTTNAKPLRFSL